MADKLQILIEINSKIDELKKTTEEVKKLSAQTDSFTKKTKKTEQDLKSLNEKFASLTKSITGMIAAYASFQGAKAFVGMVGDIEEGFVGVAKTTGLAGEQFDTFKGQIKEMSTNLAGVSINELQSIAQTAGQLGIQGSEDLSKFTETIAKIAIATDLTADEASNAFARLTNILGEPISEVERMGSTINELSNTSTATARDITEFALRIGGASEIFGLTTDQVFAFSASLKDAGLNAELGGTNFSKFLSTVLSDMGSFADFVGQDINDFAQTLQNEPVKAIEAILSKLKELDATAKLSALDELGLTGTEMQRVMLALSGTLDKVKTNLATGAKEWKDNTSLQREYETASESLNAKLKQLNNAFVILVNEIGEGLLPNVKEAVEGITEFGKSLDKDKLKAFGEGIGELISAIGSLVKGFVELYGENATLINSVAKLVIGLTVAYKTFGLIASAVVALKTGFAIATTGVVALRTALLSLNAANPILLGLAALVAGVSAGVEVYASRVEAKTNDLNKATAELGDSTEKLKEINETLSSAFTGEGFKLSEEAINKLKESISSLIVENSKQIEAWQNDDPTKYATQIASLTKQNETLAIQLDKVSQIEPFKEIGESAENARQVIARLSKEQIDEIAKTNKKRESDHTKTLESLRKEEENLSKSIVDIQKDLQSKLADLERDRVGSIEAIEGKIRDIKRSNMSDTAAYYDTQRQAEENLSKARQALINGDLESYKRYASEYQSLITQNAGKAIEEDGKVKVSKEQTAQAAIAGLNNLKGLENQYYAQKQAQEVQAHNQKISMLQVELQATRAKIQVEQQQLELTKQLIEAITGKSLEIDIDTQAGQTALKELEATYQALESQKININADPAGAYNAINGLNATPLLDKNMGVYADTTQATYAVQTFGALTLNDKTIQVTADTTPADFGIKKLVSETKGNETTIKINPEYREAQRKIDELRNPKPAKVEVSANTAKADADIKKVTSDKKGVITFSSETANVQSEVKKYENVKGKITFDVNDSQARAAKAQLQQNTSSTHTIYVRKVETHQSGGMAGGFTRRSGKLGGYGGGDKIPALLEAGEFIVKKEAVKRLGADTLYSLNEGAIQKYATGGLVTSKQRYNVLESITRDNYKSGYNDTIDIDTSGFRELVQRLELLSVKLGYDSGAVSKINSLSSTTKAEDGRYKAEIANLTTQTADAGRETENLKTSVQNKELSEEEYKTYTAKLAELEKAKERVAKALEKLQKEIENRIDELNHQADMIEATTPDSVEQRTPTAPTQGATRAVSRRREKKTKEPKQTTQRREIYVSATSADKVWANYKDARSVVYDHNKKRYLVRFQEGGMLSDFQVRQGRLEGYGGGDRVPALLEQGEFVVRKEAVKKYGDDFLYKLNNFKLNIPKYQTGGVVGDSISDTLSIPSAPSSLGTYNINIEDTRQNVATLQTDDIAIAKALEKYLKRRLS